MDENTEIQDALNTIHNYGYDLSKAGLVLAEADDDTVIYAFARGLRGESVPQFIKDFPVKMSGQVRVLLETGVGLSFLEKVRTYWTDGRMLGVQNLGGD